MLPCNILTSSVRYPARQIEYDCPTAEVSEKICDDRNREREKEVLRHLDATIAWCRGLDEADTARAKYLEKERSRKEVKRSISVSATDTAQEPSRKEVKRGIGVVSPRHQQEGGSPAPQESGSKRQQIDVSRLDWIAVLEWFVICTIFGIASGIGLYLLRE